MRRILILPALLLATVFHCQAQSRFWKDSVSVEARAWSRDSLRQIQYAPWQSYTSYTVDGLQDFDTSQTTPVCRYGGDLSVTRAASGYFRTEKINQRWYLIDPDGHPFISAGVTSFRQGKSPANLKAFSERYGSPARWTENSAALFQRLGFNTAGSWSDLDAIRNYNQKADQPLPYTTQLGLLSGFVREATRKDPKRKSSSPLLFILDDAFADYCDSQTRSLTQTQNDPLLLGHFSDNEIAFTRAELKELLRDIEENPDQAPALRDWINEKKATPATLSREQSDELLGWLAGHYYRTVSAAIRRYDQHHLIIGSRLHSTAKNNPWLFAAADSYVDVVSINYYGYWSPQHRHLEEWASWTRRPFLITEFYTKAEDSGLPNISGAGWLVRTQADRGIHYQQFCLTLLQAPHCVGWHWFRYQDNDPKDPTADPSNNDSNKGIVNTLYESYETLTEAMRRLNSQKYRLIYYFDKKRP